ncbi:MAG: hypothetical protein GY874_10835 [Desulfobacteraceae bacterium]|nr:hypothetical protein [Desulfobacteraceae bacterium]
MKETWEKTIICLKGRAEINKTLENKHRLDCYIFKIDVLSHELSEFSELSHELSERSHELSESIGWKRVKKLVEVMQINLPEELPEELSGLSHELSLNLSELSKELSELSKKLSERFKKLTMGKIEQLKELSELSKKLSERSKKLSERSKELSKKLSERSKKLSERSKELSELSKEGSERSKELSEMSKEGTERSKELSERSKELSERSVKLSELSKKLSELSKKLSWGSEDLSEQSEELSERSELLSEWSKKLLKEKSKTSTYGFSSKVVREIKKESSQIEKEITKNLERILPADTRVEVKINFYSGSLEWFITVAVEVLSAMAKIGGAIGFAKMIKEVVSGSIKSGIREIDYIGDIPQNFTTETAEHMINSAQGRSSRSIFLAPIPLLIEKWVWIFFILFIIAIIFEFLGVWLLWKR